MSETNDPSAETISLETMRDLSEKVKSSIDELFHVMEEKLSEKLKSESASEALNNIERKERENKVVTITPDVLDNLINKLQTIDEKLRDLQMQHFELQHSCAAATEIARAALSNTHMGNPYLAKIDSILSHNGETNTVEDILVEAKTMINGAAYDVASIARAVYTDDEIEGNEVEGQSCTYTSLSTTMDVQLNDLDAILEARKIMKRSAGQVRN